MSLEALLSTSHLSSKRTLKRIKETQKEAQTGILVVAEDLILKIEQLYAYQFYTIFAMHFSQECCICPVVHEPNETEFQFFEGDYSVNHILLLMHTSHWMLQ